MAKNTSGDDLMEIILSMSGNERRYFKMHAMQWGHTSAAILKLYEFLVTAQKWCDADIRQQFKGAPFLKQLNGARTRLQQTILEALRNYDNGRTYQLDFSRRLDEIDVLFRRKLISPCFRMAKTAQRRAQLLELPLQELSVLAWLLRLERQKGGADLPARLAALHRRHNHVTRQVTLETDLLELHDAMLALLPQQTTDHAQRTVSSEALLLSPQLQLLPDEMALDARILWHYTHAYYAFIRSNYIGYWQQLGSIVKIWEALPERMRMEEARTFKILTGYAEGATLAGALASIPKTIEKLKRLLERSTTLRPVEMARILNIELEYLSKSERYTEASRLAPQVEHCMKMFASTIAHHVRLSLTSNLLMALFVAAQWENVPKWATILDSEIGPSGAEQFQGIARSSRWVAWYELHQHETLEKALKPFLKTTKSVTPGALALDFAALLASESEVQEKAAFQGLLSTLQTQQSISNLPHLDLLERWVQARLKGARLGQAQGH